MVSPLRIEYPGTIYDLAKRDNVVNPFCRQADGAMVSGGLIAARGLAFCGP